MDKSRGKSRDKSRDKSRGKSMGQAANKTRYPGTGNTRRPTDNPTGRLWPGQGGREGSEIPPPSTSRPFLTAHNHLQLLNPQ